MDYFYINIDPFTLANPAKHFSLTIATGKNTRWNLISHPLLLPLYFALIVGDKHLFRRAHLTTARFLIHV